MYIFMKKFIDTPVQTLLRTKLFVRNILLLLPLALVNHKAYAQYEYNNQFNIPSAQVWSFLRYGNTPQYLYNGTVRQDIPIYTYQDPDFTIPISLNYASNGYMANVQASQVGLGWFLTAGGSIVRQVRELPDDVTEKNARYQDIDDEFREGYYSYHLLPSPPNAGGTIWERGEAHLKGKDKNFLWNYCRTYLFSHLYTNPAEDYGQFYYDPVGKKIAAETLPDIFTFNFMGHKGKFIMGPQQKIYVYATDEPHGEYTVDLSNFRKAGDQNHTSKIVIQTADGYSYIFGGADNFQYIDYTSSNANEWVNGTANLIEVPHVQYHWPLTKIIAPNGRSVTFEYGLHYSENVRHEGRVGSSNVQIDELGWTVGNGNWHFGTYLPVYRSTNISYITSIRIDNDKKIEFTYNSNRKKEKRYAPPDTISELSTPPRLEKISIQANNLTYKEATLSHDYAPSTGNEVMFLKSVEITDDGKYQMEYYDGSTGAGPASPFPYHGTCGVDHWGYYNNNNEYAYPLYYQAYYSDPEPYFVAYHSPDSIGAMLGLLKKISYPTQGYSTFEYEKQTYSRSAENNLTNIYYPLWPAGATRTGGGLRIKKITDYASTNSYSSRTYEYGNGYIRFFPRYSLSYDYQSQTIGANLSKMRLPDPIHLIELISQPIDSSAMNATYGIKVHTKLIGSILSNPYSYDQPALFYGSVKEIYADNSFCVNDYSFIGIIGDINSINYYYPFGYHVAPIAPIGFLNCPCTVPQQNACIESSCIYNLYRRYPSLSIYDGKLIRKTLYNSNGIPLHRIRNEYSPEKIPAVYTSVQVADKYMYILDTYIEDRPLSKTTEDYYFNQDTLRKVTQYTYNPQGQLICNEFNDSELSTQTKIQYIPDIPVQTRTGIQDTMYNQGRIKYPVKTQTSIKRPFHSTYMLTNGQSYIYGQINRNDTLDFRLTDVWETHLSAPVNRSDFSFDDLLNHRGDTYAYYTMSSRIKEVLSKTGLVTTYLWAYHYQYPIAEIKNATYDQVKAQIPGGQTTIDAIASGDTLSSSHQGIINGLRTALPNAQVTTYTYNPLIGLQTVIDPRGMKTTYIYDAFGRLQAIKEDNNKLVESYEYHYKTP